MGDGDNQPGVAPHYAIRYRAPLCALGEPYEEEWCGLDRPDAAITRLLVRAAITKHVTPTLFLWLQQCPRGTICTTWVDLHCFTFWQRSTGEIRSDWRIAVQPERLAHDKS